MPSRIDSVSSSLTECTSSYLGTFFLQKKTNSGKREERELAKIDANRRAVGTLNPARDKKIKACLYRGGRRDDTCDLGLFRRSPRVKKASLCSYELSWKVKAMMKK